MTAPHDEDTRTDTTDDPAPSWLRADRHLDVDESVASDDAPLADDALEALGADGDAADLSRADRRRLARDVVEEGAPQEGVDIIRPVERAVIVGLQLPGVTDAEVAASLDELAALLDTAGAEVVERVVQRRDAPEAATFIGKGKVDELADLVKALDADAVVFDDDLAPAQQRTLEERIRQKVLDRTIVILDIFAQHASSREGKAQVELAQLTYMLPRLRGWGEALSRQAGGRTAGGAGIGGRGPGETQLEVDRRRINRRIAKLKADLEDYDRIRRTKAKERENRQVHSIALVGYTNAGKSSLLNRMTGADALVQDQLFATLDPTVRQLDLPDGRNVVLTDTVGFVRKLPHGLVEAFMSTLEESARSDLLLLVVDASHPEAEAHLVAVREVLEEIGASETHPEIVVLNKVDAADPVDVASLARHVEEHTDLPAVAVSAVTGEGIDDLRDVILERLPGRRLPIVADIPYARGDLVALLHRQGEVTDEEHHADGTRVHANVDQQTAAEVVEFLEDDPFAVPAEPWE